MIRPPGHDLKRIGGDRHFKRVMLRRPGNFKSRSIGHLHHIEHMIAHFAHIRLGIHAF